MANNYTLFENGYCSPSSADIDQYTFGNISSGIDACNNNTACVGITLNKNDSEWKLKSNVDGVSARNTTYDCYVKPENESNYLKHSNSYCVPSSTDQSSNIGNYESGRREEAIQACNNDTGCVGFTYKKNEF